MGGCARLAACVDARPLTARPTGGPGPTGGVWSSTRRMRMHWHTSTRICSDGRSRRKAGRCRHGAVRRRHLPRGIDRTRLRAPCLASRRRCAADDDAPRLRGRRTGRGTQGTALPHARIGAPSSPTLGHDRHGLDLAQQPGNLLRPLGKAKDPVLTDHERLVVPPGSQETHLPALKAGELLADKVGYLGRTEAPI